MQTIQIKSLETIREAAKEFIAGMDDRTVFAFYGPMGRRKPHLADNAYICIQTLTQFRRIL